MQLRLRLGIVMGISSAGITPDNDKMTKLAKFSHHIANPAAVRSHYLSMM